MKSTPADPYLFIFDGKIPALKNGKMIHWVEDAQGNQIPKVYSNKEVQNWYEGQRKPLFEQLALQDHLDRITQKRRACCRFELFSKNALSSLDADNVYTTVQDLLQVPSKETSARKHKGILGIVDTDRYVQSYSVHQRSIVDIRGAFLWVWETEMDRDDIDDLIIWRENRSRHVNQRMKKKTLPHTFFS